jgi:multicomponent Na+:H+ antiporter subunit F
VELAYLLFALALTVNLAVGLLRVLRGPRLPDRLLAAQLFATTGVTLLLVLAAAQSWPSLRDVALVFALLGLLAAVVFTRLRPAPECSSRGPALGGHEVGDAVAGANAVAADEHARGSDHG